MEATNLLLEDAGVSDLGLGIDGRAQARLCSHHDQVYKTLRYKNKCSVVTCLRQARGA
jgi:hypothetical protein